jgi:hypothetical protein
VWPIFLVLIGLIIQIVRVMVCEPGSGSPDPWIELLFDVLEFLLDFLL